ncbi:hypothetical protein ATKI12_8522 [Kitasatospora sp. Ki12]
MSEPLPSRVECWCCSNGLVLFCVDTASGRPLLECEECMSARWAPPGGGEGGQEPGFLTIDMPTRPATRAEIRAAGWEHLVRAR